MERVLGDLKVGIRGLLRAPGYAIGSVLVLGFGIGVSVAALAIGNRALVAALPYAEPDRLFTLFETTPSGGARAASRPTVHDWRADSKLFESMAYLTGTQLLLREGVAPEQVTVAMPPGNFFSLLGSSPAVGRVIMPDDDAKAERVVVLSDPFWRRRFAGHPDVIGRSIRLGDGSATVIGVMPASFSYPEWADAWMPESTAPASLRPELELRGNHADSRTIGRLKRGVTVAQAQAELNAIARRLAEAFPADSREWTTVGMIAMPQYVQSATAQFNQTSQILVVLGAALLVLALGATNVAALGLVRGFSRGQELAVRSALGASRAEVARLLLLESVILAVAGGALGAGLGYAIVRLCQRWNQGLFPRLIEIRFDAVFIVSAIVLAGLVALASGLVPALKATPRSLNQILGGARGAVGAGRQASRLQGGLIVAQVAMAFTLVIGALLLVKSLARVVSTPIGIDVPHLSAIGVFPPIEKYGNPDRLAGFYRGAMETVSRIPGVTSVGFVNHAPLSGSSIPTQVTIEGRAAPTDQPDVANFKTISPNYFATAGITIVRGRGYSETDLAGPNGSLVINQNFAKRYWPGQDPIGKRVTIHKAARWLPDYGQPLVSTVIGVASDVRDFGPETNPQQEVYVPYTWNLWRWGNLVIRSTLPPASLADPVRKALLELEPDLPLAGTASFGALGDQLVALQGPRRLLTVGIAGLGFAALGIAMIGLYALLAYTVTRRRAELGIRAALGASRSQILGQVAGQGLKLVGIGLAIGLGASLALSRLLAGLVFGISTRDLSVFLVAPGVLLAVGAFAVYWPARRAASVNPIETLR